MEIERRIEMAQGYAELNLFSDSRAVLAALPEVARASFEAIEVLVLCEIGEHQWEQALLLSAELCRLHPSDPGGFLHTAFCLHELGRTEEAVQVLMHGPRALRLRSIYFYNLGCYNARLGHPATAVQLLERAFAMDQRLRRVAKHDRDLDELRRQLS
jgi:Flp pilus assembly protein TadD